MFINFFSEYKEYADLCRDQSTLKAQKRRGKLVRDRTIDNADENSSSFNGFNSSSSSNNNNTSYGPTSPAKMTDTIKKCSSERNPFLYQKSNDSTSSNSRLDGGGTSPLSSAKDELAAASPLQQPSSFTGRISPPEKRFSLSTHNILDHSELANGGSSGPGGGDANSPMKKQPFMCAMSPDHQMQSQNLNLIVSHLLNNPRLLTKELRKQFSNQKSHMMPTNDTIVERDASDSSSSSLVVSEAVSPSQSSTSSISSNLLGRLFSSV